MQTGQQVVVDLGKQLLSCRLGLCYAGPVEHQGRSPDPLAERKEGVLELAGVHMASRATPQGVAAPGVLARTFVGGRAAVRMARVRMVWVPGSGGQGAPGLITGVRQGRGVPRGLTA